MAQMAESSFFPSHQIKKAVINIIKFLKFETMIARPRNTPVRPQTHFCTLSLFIFSCQMPHTWFQASILSAKFNFAMATQWVKNHRRQKQSSAFQGLEELVGFVWERPTAGCRKSPGICLIWRNWVWGIRDHCYSSSRSVQISFFLLP